MNLVKYDGQEQADQIRDRLHQWKYNFLQETQAGMQQIFERCEKGRKWRSLFLLGRQGSTKDNQMVQFPETFKRSAGRKTDQAD